MLNPISIRSLSARALIALILLSGVVLRTGEALASGLPGSEVLPSGPTTPRAGAKCGASYTDLGTSNVYGNAIGTSAVNIWELERKSNGSNVGYLVKALDGSFWYEPPIYGLQYQKLDKMPFAILLRQPVRFVGCFTRDLPRSAFAAQ